VSKRNLIILLIFHQFFTDELSIINFDFKRKKRKFVKIKRETPGIYATSKITTKAITKTIASADIVDEVATGSHGGTRTKDKAGDRRKSRP
jgi:isocitrate lyase